MNNTINTIINKSPKICKFFLQKKMIIFSYIFFFFIISIVISLLIVSLTLNINYLLYISVSLIILDLCLFYLWIFFKKKSKNYFDDNFNFKNLYNDFFKKNENYEIKENKELNSFAMSDQIKFKHHKLDNYANILISNPTYEIYNKNDNIVFSYFVWKNYEFNKNIVSKEMSKTQIILSKKIKNNEYFYLFKKNENNNNLNIKNINLINDKIFDIYSDKKIESKKIKEKKEIINYIEKEYKVDCEIFQENNNIKFILLFDDEYLLLKKNITNIKKLINKLNLNLDEFIKIFILFTNNN